MRNHHGATQATPNVIAHGIGLQDLGLAVHPSVSRALLTNVRLMVVESSHSSHPSGSSASGHTAGMLGPALGPSSRTARSTGSSTPCAAAACSPFRYGHTQASATRSRDADGTIRCRFILRSSLIT